MKEVIWDISGIAGAMEHIGEAIGGIARAHEIGEGRVDGLEHVFVGFGIGSIDVVGEPESIHPAIGGKSVREDRDLIDTRGGVDMRDA